jgi:hypothetical protein
MLLPIYEANADTRTQAGRRAGLVAWVSAPFRAADVIGGMAREFDADIGLQITDSTEGAADAGTSVFGDPQ